MNRIAIESFSIMGISVRTTNESGQSSEDIPALWDKFLSGNIIAQIPNKTDDTVYSVYSDYEGDHTKPYSIIIGCKVKNLDSIPEGLIGKSFSKGQYLIFTAKGKLSDGIIYKEWEKIWNSGIKRKYTADFEMYGEKAKDPEDAEIDIYIAVE